MVETVSAQPLPANTQSGTAVQDLEPGTELRAKVDANLPGGVVRLVSEAKSVELRVPNPLPVGSEVTVTVSGTKQQPAIVLTPASGTETSSSAGQAPAQQAASSGGQAPAGGTSGPQTPQPQATPPTSQPAQTVSAPSGLPRPAPVVTQFLQATGVLPQSGQASGPVQSPAQSPGPFQAPPQGSTPLAGGSAGTVPGQSAGGQSAVNPPLSAGGTAVPLQGAVSAPASQAPIATSVAGMPTVPAGVQNPVAQQGQTTSGQIPAGTSSGLPGAGTGQASSAPVPASGGAAPTSPATGAAAALSGVPVSGGPPTGTSAPPVSVTVPQSGQASQAASGQPGIQPSAQQPPSSGASPLGGQPGVPSGASSSLPGQAGQAATPSGSGAAIPVPPAGNQAGTTQQPVSTGQTAAGSTSSTGAPPATGAPPLPSGQLQSPAAYPSTTLPQGGQTPGQGAAHPAVSASGSLPASGSSAPAPGLPAGLASQSLNAQSGPAGAGASGTATVQFPVHAYSAARPVMPAIPVTGIPAFSSASQSRPPASPLEQAAATVRLPLADQQASLGALFAQIGSLMSAQAAGKASVPDAVQKAMQQILGLRLNSGQQVTGTSLQQAVQQSGQFKEGQLPLPSTGPQPAVPDLKSALLSFKSLLQQLGAEPAVRFPARQPAAPSRQGSPQGQAPQASSGYWAGSAPQNLQSLLQETDAALARMRLTQLVNGGLAGDDGPQAAAGKPMDAVVELPLAFGQETAVMQMQIGRDGGGQNGEEEDEPAWRLRFALDLTATGPLEAAVSLRGGGTYVSLWVDRKETLNLLTGQKETMEAAFADAGLDLQELRFIRGLPPKTAAKYGALINQKS